MTYPISVPGHKFKLSYYDGSNSPGSAVFACGITAQSFNLTASPIEAPSRDCVSPTAGPEMSRAPGVPSAEISGSGQYVAALYGVLYETMKNRKTKRWLIERMQGEPPAETVAESWDGEFVITALSMEAPADGQNFATISISLVSNFLPVHTPPV